MINFLQEKITKLCLKLELPKYIVLAAEGRKNMLLVKLKMRSSLIINAVWTESGYNPFLQRKVYTHIDKCFQELFKIALEEHFNIKVRDIMFFPRVREENEEQLYFAVIFEQNVFKSKKKNDLAKNATDEDANAETVLMRRFTETMKTVSARRAKSTRVYVLPNGLTLYYFEYFYTAWERQFAFEMDKGTFSYPYHYEVLMENILLETVQRMEEQPDKALFFTVYDLDLNKGMILRKNTP